MRTNREWERREPEAKAAPAPEAPRTTPQQILALQRTAGNQAVARAIEDRPRPVTPRSQRRRIHISPDKRPAPAPPTPAPAPAAQAYSETPVSLGYSETPSNVYGEPIPAPSPTPSAGYVEELTVDPAALEHAERDGEALIVEEEALRGPEERGVRVQAEVSYAEVGEGSPESESEDDEEEEVVNPGPGTYEEVGESAPQEAEEQIESLGYAEVTGSPEAVDRAVGRDGFLADAVEQGVPLAAVVDDVAKRRRKLEKKRKHYGTKGRVEVDMYKGEERDAAPQIAVAIGHAEKSAAANGITTAESLKKFFGWSDDDVAKYLENKGQGAHVQYLTPAERDDYKLELGPTIKQKGAPFTTKGMFSKFSKDDFAIFVMSQGGEWYAGRHKVGFFHHTSFLGASEMDTEGMPTGGTVAGAGEMKVIDGTLKEITNKSGHYWPDKQMLEQTLHELKEAGVGLGGVAIKVFDGTTGGWEPFSGDAAAFYDQNRNLV